MQRGCLLFVISLKIHGHCTQFFPGILSENFFHLLTHAVVCVIRFEVIFITVDVNDYTEL